ncbi:phosphate signaling complex protein PhoU [Desulfoferrobacter suflitae]|uniref:phosphate signaling complex protein PhoU n=1 Tax=Desulfoferrobacter suflitae TaxID=2865782 RepID=UPI002164043C|nr:phosphate signaling complex protein PhoU [Desulfoferrobacter suflitae]MCK8602508.1 phosphate signaling complex protein PhoU [Desulfoferrobacter suflitae]
MGSRFHEELEQLKMAILRMAALTERALENALQSFFDRNVEQAKEVIAGDQEINLLEVDIDKYSLRLLALDQPMASDLRFIVGCMRIAVDLERIADQAVNIAERTIFLASRPPLPPNPQLEQLADTALDMLKTVIGAFVNGNTDQAYDVCQMDDTADELNAAILKNQIKYILHAVPAVERSVQTIIAARCIERAADQATNIAESVIFIVKGVNIKHHCES